MHFLDSILDKKLELIDGIYCGAVPQDSGQETELEFRKKIAELHFDDYLDEISHHHSIPVMDKEIEKFLTNIPQNGVIVDVGGCWGWHWRNLDKLRPDVKVIIIDFVKENFTHAKKLVRSELLGNQIFLIHGDATQLPFKDNIFDGYWTVQTLQHVPTFSKAIEESFRVLKESGVFINYSLNNQKLIHFIKKIFGKNYHVKGQVDSTYYLERFSPEQLKIIQKIYNKKPVIEYNEVIFKPSIGLQSPGKLNSFLGKIDKSLTNSLTGFGFARQVSCFVSRSH
jgi:ubiquinone/menaquinone biosynthesis C-methylase UbiE